MDLRSPKAIRRLTVAGFVGLLAIAGLLHLFTSAPRTPVAGVPATTTNPSVPQPAKRHRYVMVVGEAAPADPVNVAKLTVAADAFADADAAIKRSLRRAMAAYRIEDYAGTRTELQGLESNADLTADQRQAIHDLLAELEKFTPELPTGPMPEAPADPSTNALPDTAAGADPAAASQTP